MPTTMHWRILPNLATLIVHTDEAPSDEDWNTCVSEVAKHGASMKGLLIYTVKAGPSPAQRARSNEVTKTLGPQFKTVIMTASRMVQGIVTALSWTIGSSVRAFSTVDFKGAADYLDLSEEERQTVRLELRMLARTAGITIDAFADESGWFRKRNK